MSTEPVLIAGKWRESQDPVRTFQATNPMTKKTIPYMIPNASPNFAASSFILPLPQKKGTERRLGERTELDPRASVFQEIPKKGPSVRLS